MDFSAYPTLTPEDRDQLQHGSGTLVILNPTGGATVYFPVGDESEVASDRKTGRFKAYVEAAKAVNAVVVDARQCQIDGYITHMMNSSLPAIGRFADQKITDYPGPLGWESIESHALSYVEIGAVVFNASKAQEAAQ